MIEPLLRWTRTSLSGGGVILTAPHDPSMTVRIEPGQRPLRSLRAIVAARTHDALPFGPVERIVTETGEHAAMIALHVAGVCCTIGVAIGDEAYTLIEGTASDPSTSRRLVEELLRSRLHTDAPDRAQMVAYHVPKGWLGIRRPLATCWLAPRSPRDRSRIVVCDALPVGRAVELTQQLLWPCDVPASAVHDTIEHAQLRGTLASWTHDSRVSALADLSDGAYCYRTQLHDGDAAALDALRTLVASLEPILRPVPTSALAASEIFGWLS